MSFYRAIRANRRRVAAGSVVATLLAAGMIVLRVALAEHTDASVVLGSVALGMALGLPAIYAWLSLDRRPSLLLAAVWAGVVSALLSSVFLVVWLVPLYLWATAWSRRPVAIAESTGAVRRIALAAMVVAAFLVLFIHEDPVCRDTYADGRVVEIDASQSGFESGWKLGFGGGSSTGTAQLGADSGVTSSSCDSDRIVLGESLASLLISAGAIGWAFRWPQGAGVNAPDHEPA